MLEALISRGPVLLDGAMGTMLMDKGLEAGEAPERFVLERPQAVVDVHRQYAEAGASVLETNTFGASRLRLEHTFDPDQMARINKEAARLAREACPASAAVAGCIGPSGLFLPPVGDADPEALRDSFAAQAESLAEGGVDFLLVETMVDLREAAEALKGARKATDLPVVVTLTFSRTPRGFFTIMGDDPAKTARELADLGAAALGANCTLLSDDMVKLAREFLDATRLPLLFQPNAGQPEIRGGSVVYPGSPEKFASDLRRMVSMGVTMVGGCCGTTPEYIRLARRLLGPDHRGSGVRP